MTATATRERIAFVLHYPKGHAKEGEERRQEVQCRRDWSNPVEASDV